MSTRLVVVTSYSNRPLLDSTGKVVAIAPADFLRLWFRNTLMPGKQYLLHHRAIVINAGGKIPADRMGLDWLPAEAPAGESEDAWTASFVLACLMAHHNGADLLFKSLDCLAFGPWLDRLYSELAGVGMVGDTSLMLVKSNFLLPLVGQLLTATGTAAERLIAIGKNTGQVAPGTMGFGASRPIDFTLQSFYVSGLSDDELKDLRMRELV